MKIRNEKKCYLVIINREAAWENQAHFLLCSLLYKFLVILNMISTTNLPVSWVKLICRCKCSDRNQQRESSRQKCTIFSGDYETNFPHAKILVNACAELSALRRNFYQTTVLAHCRLIHDN